MQKYSSIFKKMFSFLKNPNRKKWKLHWSIVVLTGLSITGCAHQKPKPSATPLTEISALDEPRSITIPIPEKLPCIKQQQAEISRLKKLLAEKDKLIQMHRTREQNQALILNETTSEVSRAQAKLHRLATRPGAVAKIAEAEVTLENLEKDQFSESDQLLIKQAQRLLNAATIAFEENDYANAMNHAAQSQALIEMVANSNRGLSDTKHAMVILRTPVLLRTRNNDGILYLEPDEKAEVLSKLNKHAALSANAHHDRWLRVQTDDGQLGWILKTLVETRILPQEQHD